MCAEQYEFTNKDLNPRFLFTCFQKRTEEEQKYHAHDFIEIAVILKGKGTFFIDGKEQDVEEGTMLILNPGTYHKSIPKEGGTTEFYMAFRVWNFRIADQDICRFFREKKCCCRCRRK